LTPWSTRTINDCSAFDVEINIRHVWDPPYNTVIGDKNYAAFPSTFNLCGHRYL
jgi:hypothetical protein